SYSGLDHSVSSVIHVIPGPFRPRPSRFIRIRVMDCWFPCGSEPLGSEPQGNQQSITRILMKPSPIPTKVPDTPGSLVHSRSRVQRLREHDQAWDQTC